MTKEEIHQSKELFIRTNLSKLLLIKQIKKKLLQFTSTFSLTSSTYSL